MKTHKERNMDMLADHIRGLYRKPDLRQLFLELTLRCNEHCFHCGSNCMPQSGEELSVDEYRRILEEVKEDFDLRRLYLCITGGEPLLRPEFFDILGYAHELGYRWGMTTNATLITREVARRLAGSGMLTVSVSIDGLRETHDRLRGLPGGYDAAMRGIQNLIDEKAFQNVQVTTVVTHKNIGELDELFRIFNDMDIDSWRVINMEPMGRAKEHPELILTPDDYRTMFEFIRNKRMQGEPVSYGCSHYLGMEYEREVRDWYYLCTAGLYTASICANGDIIACLDIERRPEFIQGNVLRDRFSEVWNNKFSIFRRDLSDDNEVCSKCDQKDFCHGDAYHSWDFDNNRPQVCFKDILF